MSSRDTIKRDLSRLALVMGISLWLGAAGGVLGAGPWYVAKSGASGDGLSWATAFTNLQTAITNAQSGDTIYLKGETFSNDRQSTTNGEFRWIGKPLTILGGYTADGGTPGSLTNTQTILLNTTVPNNLPMTNRIFYISGVTNGTLARVTVKGGVVGNTANQNTPFDSFQGGGLYVADCSNLVIASVIFDGNGVYGKRDANAFGGALFATNSVGTLTNCTIRNSFVTGYYFTKYYGSGAYLSGGAWTFRDCMVRDNALVPGHANGTARGMGLYVASGTHLFKNCVISRNVTPSLTPSGDALYVENGTVDVENCTVYWHQVEGIRRAAGTVRVKDSIVWENGDDIAGTGLSLQYCDIQDGDSNGVAGCFSADPRFERALYLATNSPCVNTGSQTAAAAGLDGRTTRADGTTDSGQVDLGYHFASAPQDYYVSVNNGNDANLGTSAGTGNAFKTIGKALAVAGDGALINIEAGLYGTNTETFPLTLANRYGVQLRGTNAAATVINAKGANRQAMKLTFVYPNFHVGDVTITGVSRLYSSGNSGALGDGGGGLCLSHTLGTVASCLITNNALPAPSGWGSVAGAGLYSTKSDLVLTNCLVKGNTAQSWYPDQCYAAGLYADQRITILNSSIVSNRSYTTGDGSYHPNTLGGGLYLNADAIIRNCLIQDNNADNTANTYPHGDGLYVGGGTVRLENCTVVSNAGIGVERGAGIFGVTNSILWGNGDDVSNNPTLGWSCIEDGDSVGVNGCISNNPAFASGYQLPVASPCINTGTNLAWMGNATDLAGNKRIRNMFADMGAYETLIPLSVTNLPATAVSASYATLNGKLRSDGEAVPARVWVYWGPTDGGTDKTLWANTNEFGVWPEQTALSTNVALTPPSGTYVYRFYASNTVTEAWSDPAASFTILDVRVEATDANAAELGPDAGVFTVTRSVVTADPLTVNFTVGGSATEGTDYAAIGSSVVIPANQSNATVTVTPKPDRIREEGSETVSLTLATGSYIINAQSNAAVAIADWIPPAYACVAPGGDSSYGTNWSSAYTNLQFALDSSISNDTIYLAGGTYALPGQLNINVSDRTIAGGYSTNGVIPGAWSVETPTILTGTGGYMRIISVGAVTNVTLDRLTIQGGWLNGSVYGAGLYASGATNLTLSSLTVRQNVLEGGGYCNNWGSGLYLENCFGVISNTLIRDNRAGRNPSLVARGVGAYVNGGGWVIQETTVRDNRVSYFYNIYGVDEGTIQGVGLYLGSGAHQVRNCLVAGNLSPAPYRALASNQGEGLYVGAGTTTVHNVTIGFHLNEGVRRAGGVLAITNSIIYGSPVDCVGVPTNTVGYSAIGVADRVFAGQDGNMSNNPAFENGYYLAAGSPCLNTGSGDAGDQGLGGSVVRADGTADTGTVDLGYHATVGMPAEKRDLYVSVDVPAASDSNVGTNWSLPLKSITRALALAVDGTRIHVGPGQYTNGVETFPLALTNRLSLQLLGSGATNTIISAARSGARTVVITLNHPDARLEGVTVQGGMFTSAADSGAYGAGLHGTLSRATIDSCQFSNNAITNNGWGSGGGAGLYLIDSWVELRNSVISENFDNERFVVNALGVGAFLRGQATVEACIVVSNKALVNGYGGYNPAGYGIGLYLDGTMGVRSTLIAGNDVTNLAIAANAYADGVYVAAGASVFENCTLADNQGEGLRQGGGTVAITNSILWNNGDDVVGTVALGYSDIEDGDSVGVGGCISANPVFVDAAAGDYRLQKISPCLNAGVNLPWSTTALDLDGTPRIKNKILDMGAYEGQMPQTGTVILIW